MSQKVRVRFAPSPTGPLHIGGVRTALFNYLFAKKHGGDFILRIEDTDQKRYVEGAEQYIIDALNWCGIPFDEGIGKDRGVGPYRQSERKHLYRQYADELLEKGHAYYAFDTASSLDFHRKDHEVKGKTFIYNWHNRLKLTNSLSLSADEVQKRIDSGEDYVIRFKSPEGETIKLEDEIRGSIEIDSNTLDDKVLFKSDGMPTYHLANIVDDHLMQITHVIRGEEWLPSLALHQLLYDAFEWATPKFAHLPLIMKPVGKGKLSKRDGDKMGFPVFPMEWTDPKTGDVSRGYKEDGYLPEAVVNFLAFLGWNPGTEQELFSLGELVQAFDLSKVSKGGAKFDPDKTKWYQHQYLQKLDNSVISDEFSSILDEKGVKTDQNVEKIVVMLKERATFISDFWELSYFFFQAPESYDEKASKKAWKEGTNELMQELAEVIKGTNDFSAENVTGVIKGWITSKEIGFGKVMMPLRLSLVGSLQGPDVFEIVAMLGKDEAVSRIQNAVEKLG
ncbi:glutamate--tRNA ligase [Spongiivirga sp. MCCC 1A20706]|uniref:glutamate--tRNA ligase n=1 Tax=Spongiivirga sp. MCCC 1A20706 TaxID=3160963 RepID=UPI003977E430